MNVSGNRILQYCFKGKSHFSSTFSSCTNDAKFAYLLHLRHTICMIWQKKNLAHSCVVPQPLQPLPLQWRERERVLTWNRPRQYKFSLTTVCLVFVMTPELWALPLEIPGPGRITMKPHIKSTGPETPSPNENLVAKVFLAASVHTNNTAEQIDKGFILTENE